MPRSPHFSIVLSFERLIGEFVLGFQANARSGLSLWTMIERMSYPTSMAMRFFLTSLLHCVSSSGVTSRLSRAMVAEASENFLNDSSEPWQSILLETSGWIFAKSSAHMVASDCIRVEPTNSSRPAMGLSGA